MVQHVMKIVTVLLLLSSAATPVLAQQDTAAAPKYGWVHSLVGSLTMTQVAFTDWTQGGENALA